MQKHSPPIPQQSLAALPISKDNQSQYNQNQCQFRQDLAIHQRFEQWAQQQPNALALSFNHQPLSYAQLNHRANLVAITLHQNGVKPGQAVAFCLERSSAAMVAILAILKTGAAYVPLDPTYPTERLNFMLEDAEVELLLTNRSHY